MSEFHRSRQVQAKVERDTVVLSDGAESHHHHEEEKLKSGTKLPEELAEEEDMKLYGFGFAYDHGHGHDHDHHGHRLSGGSELSGLGI